MPGRQANRLAALDEIAVGDGPWRHRLTEDQYTGAVALAAFDNGVERGFWPGFLGLLTWGNGWRGVVVAVPCALPYTAYTLLIFPVLVRGLLCGCCPAAPPGPKPPPGRSM